MQVVQFHLYLALLILTSFMENGKEKINKIISPLKKGFLVTELMGSSINYSNGDYSRGASGFG